MIYLWQESQHSINLFLISIINNIDHYGYIRLLILLVLLVFLISKYSNGIGKTHSVCSVQHFSRKDQAQNAYGWVGVTVKTNLLKNASFIIYKVKCDYYGPIIKKDLLYPLLIVFDFGQLRCNRDVHYYAPCDTGLCRME